MSTYWRTTLTATTKRPFYYRCTQCGALNLGMFPLRSQSSYTDKNAGLRRSTRNATMAERRSTAEAEVTASLSIAVRAALHKPLEDGWYGSDDAPGVCAACRTKQAWNVKHTWENVLLIACAAAGFITVMQIGTDLRHTRWGTVGIYALITVAFFVGYKLARKAYVAANDRVPETHRPHVYDTMETFAEAVQSVRGDGEKVYAEPADLAQFVDQYVKPEPAAAATGGPRQTVEAGGQDEDRTMRAVSGRPYGPNGGSKAPIGSSVRNAVKNGRWISSVPSANARPADAMPLTNDARRVGPVGIPMI